MNKKSLAITSIACLISVFGSTISAMAKFNENGLNDTANIFVGMGVDYCIEFWGYSESYCKTFYFANDKVTLKGNEEYMRGVSEDWGNPPYNAWVIESWNGNIPGGSGWREFWKWGWDEGCATNSIPSAGGAAYCMGPFVVLMHTMHNTDYYYKFLLWDWKKIDGKWYNHALPAGIPGGVGN